MTHLFRTEIGPIVRGRLLIAAAVAAAAVHSLAFSAAAAPPVPTPAAADRALNTWCPVLPEERADPQITTVYEGRTVAFCCGRCRKKFLADPQRFLARLPQFSERSAAVKGENRTEAASDQAGGNGHADGHAHGGAGAAAGIEDPLQRADSGHGTAGDGAGDTPEPFFGRLHPVIVHFPLAGFPLALLGFVLWSVTGQESLARADVPPLLAATLAAIASVITGNIAHDAMQFSERLHVIVERHQFVSTTVMVLGICLAALRLWRWNRWTTRWRRAYGGGLVITCVLLGVTGYLGGSLVFGPDHLRW